ncbi:hypothetical protein [Sporomusa sp. KB1]|jgi:hypothetical protein|uniref:phage protein n=1 Tax=Sporomusa sp. KB1 TaxID=943346 RepID=UPI0011A98E70|nr:hypothetical protein [Sporomusa sp. KB1]TWH46326.1 hypothetical protein Salpa_2306 [Sporomusa sp. KB1]
MSNYLYGRKFRVYVADKADNAWDVSNLRCTFSIEKKARAVSNYAEINIYNLTNDTETEIIKEGVRIIVEAGYDGIIDTETGQQTEVKQYGKIFDGDIIQFVRSREDNVDYVLSLICLDGDAFLNNGILKTTLNAGVTQRQIVEHIAQRSIVPNKTKPTEIGRISPELSTQRLPRGKVFFGMPKNYLGDIARDNAASFWVDEGKIYIAKATDIAPDEALVLTPQTGLIGSPQQVQDGVSFRCLLNPAIKLQTMIKLDNVLIRQAKYQIGLIPSKLDEDGQYQVYKLNHIGDTRGDEWYTEVIGVSRYGLMPLMLATADQNPQ